MQTQEIPGYCTSQPPEDYFDFDKLSYSKWLEVHPQMHQRAEPLSQPLQDIQAHEERGCLASKNYHIELFNGDYVSWKVEGDNFLIGKIRRIAHSSSTSVILYDVWFYKPSSKTADIWNHHTS